MSPLQSGFPFTAQLSYNPSNNGDTRNPVRPFINPNFTGNPILGTPAQWFNPNVFLQPPANSGFFGNATRDNLVGPGLATWDFSTIKNTKLRESLSLQFRAEIFNLLNRANFNTPGADYVHAYRASRAPQEPSPAHRPPRARCNSR